MFVFVVVTTVFGLGIGVFVVMDVGGRGAGKTSSRKETDLRSSVAKGLLPGTQMQQQNAIEDYSELVRGHGLRRARYKGFAKVDLQNQLIATACNIKRCFRRLLRTALIAKETVPG